MEGAAAAVAIVNSTAQRFRPPVQETQLSHQDMHPPQTRLPAGSTSSSIFDVSWKPNASSRVCTVCTDPFGVFRRRRHHCRLCGNLVCSACSTARSFVRKTTRAKLERTCSACTSTLRQLVNLGDARVKLTVAAIPRFRRSKSTPAKNAANYACTMTLSASATKERPPQPTPPSLYVISKAWYSRHCTHEKTATVGPISNHTLISFFEGKLIPNAAVKPTDYICLDERGWRALAEAYGGGPTITTTAPSAPSSEWVISFPPKLQQYDTDPVGSFADTMTSIVQDSAQISPPSNYPQMPAKSIDEIHTRARLAAAVFAEAASSARREAETMAMRKSMASLADVDDLPLSITSRFSMY
ncbi:hypothetical protein H310_14138 [Aphanomyces invadans]|uniref:FYVE-type domain-containing protein n=1 Tax=Aphanomyces invadans TaxID=157072 RepID=A0A024TB97_9STRA|nr:hypothetical protein H310_14138 [Aphanomyces invadans]ETV91318.1 hypothetical protein H310_14138 [Aphanomyces invadans]|eukprot:XP_008880155.1 hypothetical protein H310_14138 [Aphanomyces invadans]